MTAELTALTLAALLQVVQYALYALPANRELGTRYTGGSRGSVVDGRLAKLREITHPTKTDICLFNP